MEIKRDRYLNQLISYQWDGQVKVVTGIRRCGKSYLLRTLYKKYLLSHGVAEDQIISIELDLTKDIRYRNPLYLSEHVRDLVRDESRQYYLFIDEIQMLLSGKLHAPESVRLFHANLWFHPHGLSI